jgi:LacI family transcriptional regulator
LALVVNELTPESRAALIARRLTMVIGTPLPQLCQDMVRLAAEAVAQGMPSVPGQHFLQPELFLPESV